MRRLKPGCVPGKWEKDGERHRDPAKMNLGDMTLLQATTLPLPCVRRLILADFRSYRALDLAFNAGLVVFFGENGAGKTNLLEALSFLTPGRGLRRAELAECARIGGNGAFALSVELATSHGDVQLGTGTELQPDGALLRRYRCDREAIASIRAFADHVRVVWLTPAMDGLFTGAAGERRRF